MQVKRVLFFFVFADFIKVEFKADFFEKVFVDQHAESIVFFHLNGAGAALVKGFVDDSAEDHLHDFFGGLHVGRNLGFGIEVRQYLGQRGAVGIAKGVEDLLGGGLAHRGLFKNRRGMRGTQSYCTAAGCELGLCMRLLRLFNLLFLAILMGTSCAGPKMPRCDYAAPQFDPSALAAAKGFDSLPQYSAQAVDLAEASGAVYCSWDSSAIWVIEDGGSGPNLFLVNTATGRITARLQLAAGWANVDWEDLTHWTDTLGQRWLGIAEIGDNNAVRSSGSIFGIPEPVLDDTTGAAQIWTPAQTMVWNFVYEDGPRDAESLFTDPVDGRMYLVTKRDARNRVYVLPAQPSGALDTARAVADLPIFMSTAADRSVLSSGQAPLVVRSYGRLYYWAAEAHEAACTVLQRTPLELPYPDQEAQGEIFAWLRDGSYVLLSERLGNAAPLVQRFGCLP